MPPIDTSKKSGKLALLVGIDKYDIPAYELHGCVNDALDMQDLLVNHFGFAKDDTLILKDSDATHSNIVESFRKHLIERAEKDAVVVFQYSGHGSQMRDQPGGDEADDYDESIVPADSRTGPDKFDIRDDQLNGLFRELSVRTKNITFVLDSCHSGTGVKGRGNARRIEKDDRSAPPHSPGKSTRAVVSTRNRPVSRIRTTSCSPAAATRSYRSSWTSTVSAAGP